MGYVKFARLFAYSYTYRDYTYLYICGSGTAYYVIVNVLFSNALSTVTFYLERERAHRLQASFGYYMLNIYVL